MKGVENKTNIDAHKLLLLICRSIPQ